MAKTNTFLFLSLLLITIPATLSSTAPCPPRVTITNNTPFDARVICRDESDPLSSYGVKTLNATSPRYQFSVAHQGATSSCYADWNTRYFTNWDAFSPGRDDHLKTIYWSLRKRGVYYSRDGLKWRLDAPWGTE